MVNAFVRPVPPPYRGDDDLVKASIAALDQYWGRQCDVYGTGDITFHAVVTDDPEYPLERLGEHRVGKLDTLLDMIMDALPVEEVAP
jgi:hypothetical protein